MKSPSKNQVVRLLREDGAVVCEHCTIAATAGKRMKGLLGRDGLSPGEGLLIRPAFSIHMLFMRFSIDAVFLDRELVVRKVAPNLKPWRLSAARGARSVLEIEAGQAEQRRVSVGTRLSLEELEG